MPSGVPIDRQWIFVLDDGSPVVDWGDDLIQDLLSGDFSASNREDAGHPIRDDELEMLKRAGRIERYDSRHVYIYALPERPRPTIE
ncbi:MAG: hypothetical protein MUO57_04170 [Anaerolineales bacterium]|nr:hypothetical protein [Anaerolineales bacterium]